MTDTMTERCIDKYATHGERAMATKLVHDLLAAGCVLSVRDGYGSEGEWVVKKSADAAVILDALASTDGDTLRARTMLGEHIGDCILIWGNAEDGSELLSDWQMVDSDSGRDLGALLETLID